MNRLESRQCFCHFLTLFGPPKSFHREVFSTARYLLVEIDESGDVTPPNDPPGILDSFRNIELNRGRKILLKRSVKKGEIMTIYLCKMYMEIQSICYLYLE